MDGPQAGNGGKSRNAELQVELHYVDYGGSGPPLVLIHGLGGSHLNWMLVTRQLTDDFHVYAVDLPGFGLTPPEDRSVDVKSQAEVIERFIADVVGEPAFVAGNSMGGLITMLLADHAPHLLRGAILVDPALMPPRIQTPNPQTVLFLGTPMIPGMGPWLYERRRAAVSVEDHVRSTIDFITANPALIPPEVYRAGEAMEEARRRMPWSIKAFVDAGRSIATVLARRRSFARMVHRIGVPVLLIHGDADIIVPPEAAIWLADLRPDWDFIMLPGIGHVPQLEAPDEFVTAVTEWVARVEARDTRHNSGAV